MNAIESLIDKWVAEGTAIRFVYDKEQKKLKPINKIEKVKTEEPKKVCAENHRRVTTLVFGMPVCLDCDPYYASNCRVCTAPVWRCCC